jgi:hypothetical protein
VGRRDDRGSRGGGGGDPPGVDGAPVRAARARPWDPGRVGVPDAALAEGAVGATVGEEAAGGEVFMAGFLPAARV